ncbi:MAG: alpha/beta fold hydrolase [Chloroflexota bacterium]|nr:alpha/beta fold hydrolase [Chloroflexota bacterium]
MAVETRAGTSTHATPGPAQPVVRYLLWGTAATLGVSGAAAALISAVSGFLVYQYARARGQWGTDEPPEGLAEDVKFASAQDNMRLSGWFFKALGGGPAPAVVLCHGIGTGRRECLPMALRFSAAGYNVLCFDFRAHGMSDGQFSSVGLHETDDVIGAVEYLKQRPEVDARRIGVVGFSMGAVATIQAAARCHDIAAVVADSAYASFLEAVRYSFRLVSRLPHFPVAPIAMRWAKWMVHVDPGLLRPVDVIGRITPRPILLTHGTLDEIVPVRHAYTLFKAAEEPKELWVVPEARHVEARDLDPQGYFERIERFLHQALSPSGLVASAPAAQAQSSATSALA